MGAKVSAETNRAVKLWQEGMSVGAAAGKCGILPATLYRALHRLGLKIMQPKPKM